MSSRLRDGSARSSIWRMCRGFKEPLGRGVCIEAVVEYALTDEVCYGSSVSWNPLRSCLGWVQAADFFRVAEGLDEPYLFTKRSF